MKKIIALVLALVMVFAITACGEKAPAGPDTEKSEGTLKYADYVAAAVDTEVTIEGYIQAKAYAAAYGNVNLYVQDADGAYYVYRMPCTDEDNAKLVIGAKVKIKGMRAEWAGEIEIGEGTASYEILEGSWIADAEDVTALLGTDALVNNQNKKVKFTGLTVAASTDADGNEAAFLYNWDGSGAAGSNSDVYFNVSYNGATYSFMVESDECAEGTDVYTAVTNLKVGDTIDCEGLLYWYNGANPHITAITVK